MVAFFIGLFVDAVIGFMIAVLIAAADREDD